MKIHSITIEGFRSVKGPLTMNFDQICALIGANNSGKSNLLSAIHRVLGRDWVTVNTFDDEDVYNRNKDQNIVIDITFSDPFIYQPFKGTEVKIPRIRFNYTRYVKGEFAGQRRLEKQCLKMDGELVQRPKAAFKKGVKPTFEPLTTIPQDVQENFPVIYIGTDRSLKSQLPYTRNSLLAILLADINKDFERPDNKMKGKNSLGEEVEVTRLERFRQAINAALLSLQTEELKALELSIKENVLSQLGFDPSKDTDKFDIRFFPFTSLDFYKSLELYVLENNFQINATDLGSGFQNAIVIAIVKAFEERRKEGALFLIEEPEMFLHPQMQRSLYKTIRNIGKTNQVIYITHSPNFVTIPEFDEIRIVKKDDGGTTVVQSSMICDDKLREKFRKELDPERNELFFAKKILIVEGDTEKLSIPEYSRRMAVDLDRNGVSIIEVGGKRNLKEFIELAISFKIPVAFAYDIDSSDFDKNKKDDEAKYNEALDSYLLKGATVFKFSKNYEEELKKSYEEKEYQEYSQKYPGHSKAVKARLFAADLAIPFPEFIKPIVEWLNK